MLFQRTALFALGISGLVCSACQAPAVVSADNQQAVQNHVDRAFELAGDTFMKTTATLQCTKTDLARQMLNKSDGAPAIKLFDNLYFVGKASVSSYAITTSEGIILVDSLNNSDEAREIIVSGLQSFGLDPSAIKYIIVAHGHGDHYGGASYLSQTYGARVLMTKADWELALNPRRDPPPPGFPPPDWSPAPDMDMIATDGMDLTLGDTSVRIVTTPGHTPGTISLIFPVTADGQSHMVGLWGGTGFPREDAAVRTYVDSAEKFARISSDLNVDVVLSNHPFVENSGVRMAALRNSPEKGNPFIIGAPAGQRYMGVLTECAKAEVLRREQQAE